MLDNSYLSAESDYHETIKSCQSGRKTRGGAQGRLTRLAGGLFGSDITYVVGRNVSAPGQFSIDELKQAMGVVCD